MDSQGRSRFIIGGLTLAAVLLVIVLLFTQQDARVQVVESPLLSSGTPPATVQAEADEGAADESKAVELAPAQMESPLSFAPDSPLAEPGNTLNASPPVTESATVTESIAVTATGVITAGDGVTDTVTSTSTSALTLSEALTTPITASARSTVTVTLTAPLIDQYRVEVVESYPHDSAAFTQGLQYVDGVLYEGTGLYGRSSLRRVTLATGEVEKQEDLAGEYFGEGIAVVEDRIYQLTWQSRVAFLYDRESFEALEQFAYPTEGWGLTYDGEHLLMSDGSSTIFRRDPATFEEISRIQVTDDGEPVNLLNELEYIDGLLWANIWQSNEIVLIHPETGEVIARVDLTGLLPEEMAAAADVLNGIAYDAENDRVFVTGKLWPLLFEIRLVPR